MIDVPLDGDAVEVAGILDLRPTPTGFRLRRLPAWTEPQISDLMTKAVVAMPSGCRIEFSTDSTTIELDVMITRIVTGAVPACDVVFDLVIDGSLHTSCALDEGTKLIMDPADLTRVEVEAGGPSTATFTGLGNGRKRVEVWLPHGALVELRALRVDDGASVSSSADGRRRWVHYGSSISHCMETEHPTGVWPAVAARLGGVRLQSFGFGGSCHLDQFVARTIRDMPVDLLSCKIGINIINADSLRERAFGPALHGFLDTVRDGHADIPILLASPIFCPGAEDHPGPTYAGPDGRFVAVPRPPEVWIGSMTLRRVREIISSVVETRRALGDTNLHYLDGLALFGADDAGDLPDGLHPNAAGYQRIGERFNELVFQKRGPFA